MKAKDKLVKIQNILELEKAKEVNLIVVALIATLSFATGFTLHVGYKDKKKGMNKGWQ